MAKKSKEESKSEPKAEPKLVELVVAVSHNEYTKGVKFVVDEANAELKLASGMFSRA